jgi:hypothetical protein
MNPTQSLECSKSSGLESAFLDLWHSTQANHCDLTRLPHGFDSKPILQPASLTRLLDLVSQQKAPAIRAALEQALIITTRNQGIALQMWWSQVAWLKRRLVDCVGIDWKAADITRRPITLEELLTHSIKEP